MADNYCPVCHSKANVASYDALGMTTNVICPNCGSFIITETAEDEMNNDEVAAWLYYHAKYDTEQKRFVSAYYISERNMDQPDKRYVTLQEISNWYPRTFSEKVDRFLLKLAERSETLGHVEVLTGERAISACFGKFVFDKQNGRITDGSMLQYRLFVGHLVNRGYLTPDSNHVHIVLSPEGWQRVDELQKYDTNNKEVFVSMAFNDGTKDTREAIRAGIIDAGYSPEFIDEIIHNHQIMPEMFRLIRESRFLIMDVTDPNYGAYYEAGYALGLGKEVIISCKEEVFTRKYETKEEKRLEKYMKPHFDIAQKQILVWKDYADLTKKLSEWIKSIIG